VTFTGTVGRAELARLRADAGVALVPSLFAETYALSAAEAMAAGLPVAASRIGALPELLPEDWLVAPGDPRALARALVTLRGDRAAGTLGIRRTSETVDRAQTTLAAVYS
jgi:glycosyltransferase involved in cell wall biosynthesis